VLVGGVSYANESDGEPLVCAMVVFPGPDEEDQRRLLRERKTMIKERIEPYQAISLLPTLAVFKRSTLRTCRIAILSAGIVRSRGKPKERTLKPKERTLRGPAETASNRTTSSRIRGRLLPESARFRDL
jgi:hypothetical protein